MSNQDAGQIGSPSELELRYDPMTRDELIAECEKLRNANATLTLILYGTPDDPRSFAQLLQRNAWLEEYVQACDHEIRRARGVLPTVDAPPAHQHTFVMGVCSCGERSADYLHY